MNPQSRPYAHQSRMRRDSAKRIVAHSNTTDSSAASDVSQIHSNGVITAFG